MCLPSHDRVSCTISQRFTGLIMLLCVFGSGCSSLPRFSDSPVITTAAQPIPAPQFDDMPERTQIASAEIHRGLVAEPEAFAWKTLSTSAGGRPLEGLTIGQGGYRTIVIGSLAGDDPLAIRLTEELAQHIHENQIVLGGVQATVLRNLNPDGAVSYRMENTNGVYLNRQFVTQVRTEQQLKQLEPEVRFLLGLMEDTQPQRVIHIRSVKGETGVVAASAGSMSVAKDVCGWLNFQPVKLPGNSAEGTLERYLAQQKVCEVVTFAVPQASDKSTMWEDYGDSLLNLLLAEDFETRKLARQNHGPMAADRRNAKSENGD